MSEPIIEQIAENIRETLAMISTAGGYYTNLTVERRKASFDAPADAKAVVAQGDPRGYSDSESYGTTGYYQPFDIEVTMIDAETSADTSHPDTRINRAWADIVRALYLDRTRGALAVDTRCDPPSFFTDGVVVTARVQYEHLEGDPTQQPTRA
jgi:hypothetical protein